MNFNDFFKGMLREQKERQSVPSDHCEGSGKMSKEQGNALGVSIYKINDLLPLEKIIVIYM